MSDKTEPVTRVLKSTQMQLKTDPEFVRETRALASELGLSVTNLIVMAVKNMNRDYRAGTLRIAPPVNTQRDAD